MFRLLLETSSEQLKKYEKFPPEVMMSPGGDDTCQLNVYRTVYGAKLEQHYCLEEDWFIEYFAEGI